MTLAREIPKGFQTRFFEETRSGEAPVVERWGGNILLVPCFIRKDGDEYVYFNARIKGFKVEGESYDDTMIRLALPLRQFFYGEAIQQNEMRDDYQWEPHRLAVRQAFPKYEGEPCEQSARFLQLKSEFWATVDQALTVIGKTRADLPAKFTGEFMFTFASENGMDTATMAGFATNILNISVSLLQNNRNWDELFME